MTSGFRIVDGIPWIDGRAFPWATNVRDRDEEMPPEIEYVIRMRGFNLMFESGWKLSIQFGTHNYCRNYPYLAADESWTEESATAEIALFDKDGGWYIWPDDDQVVGWCSTEFVLALVDLLSSPNGGRVDRILSGVHTLFGMEGLR